MKLSSFLANASATPPSAPGSPSVGYPQDSTPGVQPATNPGAYWFHQLEREFTNVFTAASVSQSATDHTQLLTALRALFLNVVLDSGTPCGVKAANIKLLFKRVTFTDIASGTPGNSVSITWPDSGFTNACLFVIPAFECTAGDPSNWHAAVTAKSTSGCTVQIQESFNVSNPGTLVVMGFGW